MALSPRPAMSVSFGFRDREQTESRMLIHFRSPLAATIDWLGFVASLGWNRVTMPNIIAQISDADLCYIGIRLTEKETNPGSFGTGEIEKKGVFLFNDFTGSPSFRMAIPGIKDSVLTGNGRDIDLGDADVMAYIAGFASGGAGKPITPNGIEISTPFAAYKQHRQSLSGRGRRTG